MVEKVYHYRRGVERTGEFVVVYFVFEVLLFCEHLQFFVEKLPISIVAFAVNIGV